MATHQSSVNYLNLIRDLAEMYPFEVTEVVVRELVANSLDAQATTISIDYDPHGKVLVVADNGKGMDAEQFDEYHNFAAGLKTRGTGIGFAGVGAKVSFNVAGRIITETRSQTFLGGSDWYLRSNKRLDWDDIQPTHLQGEGTRVEVRLRTDAKPSYSNTEDLVRLLRRHYLPLFDVRFLELYSQLGYYSTNLRFTVNGQILAPGDLKANLSLDIVSEFLPRKAGRRVGCGLLGLAPSEYPLGADVCGILLCTRGMVIKADLFNQFSGSLAPRIVGVVEIPGFVDFLTTPKTDFHLGHKHREFESLYGPVREEFKSWLAKLGVQPAEIGGTDDAAQLERELRKIVDDIPELEDFFGFRMRKTVLQQNDSGKTLAAVHEGVELTLPFGEGEAGGGSGPLDVGDQPGEALAADPATGTEKATPISRTAKRGPRVRPASAPDRNDLAWVEGNLVFINTEHPSYVKVRSNKMARMHHSLFAIGAAIQRDLASETVDLMFVDRMMAAWGRK